MRNERLSTQIEQERLAAEEKLALLAEARQSLSDQFQNLANNILDEKSKKFSEHNQESITRLLNPLNERMGQFSQLVQTTYEKEAKERLTLENELKRLQSLNSQLHTDAKALTQALTGTQNKSQGNWGEMILETVLENSGLAKGREYIVQAGGTRTEEDGSTRRLQPDVLINLPDHKQIIIDSKVSLTAYVRYTQSQNSSEAERELAADVASIRAHIKGLSLKQYSNIEGINTLDFVFMFIPVEPAYLLALQHDHQLFQECFEKRIMLVGPSTLLATLRTVANIWRNEQQNQNALAIAEERRPALRQIRRLRTYHAGGRGQKHRAGAKRLPSRLQTALRRPRQPRYPRRKAAQARRESHQTNRAPTGRTGANALRWAKHPMPQNK